MKRSYLRWYTPLVEVNQAILAWSYRQKVISKQMMWSVSTRPQFFKAWPCCQNEIIKLDHSLSHILTHLYVLSLQRLMSNWPINGKAIQNQNLHVTNSANQRCSWQYIRSRQNWQDSLGWKIYKNFKLCSYSLTQLLIGSGLYIIKIIKIKGWFFCYKVNPKMFWIAQMGDQSTQKIVRHKMPSSATILLAENWLLWKISWLL